MNLGTIILSKNCYRYASEIESVNSRKCLPENNRQFQAVGRPGLDSLAESDQNT